MATERELIESLDRGCRPVPCPPLVTMQLGPDNARRQRDIPKRLRQRRVIEPARPFTDPRLLGHAPRPRKGGRRGA